MQQLEHRLDIGDRNAITVYLPDDRRGPVPVLIHCHGWNGQPSYLSCEPVISLCDALMLRKVALVAFDFYGRGQNDGDLSHMTYGRWKSNLIDVTEWVRKQEWADASKIGCIGYSSGSAPALRYAEESDSLAFVISVATYFGLNGPVRIFNECCQTLINGGQAEFIGIPYSLEFFVDFIRQNPLHNLSDLHCPVFFLQGAEDNIYRRTDAWIGYQTLTYQGKPVKYLEIPGGDHLLSAVPKRMAEETIAWLGEIGIIG